jgi:hypothetical protein
VILGSRGYCDRNLKAGNQYTTTLSERISRRKQCAHLSRPGGGNAFNIFCWQIHLVVELAGHDFLKALERG